MTSIKMAIRLRRLINPKLAWIMKRICIVLSWIVLALCACNRVETPEVGPEGNGSLYHLNVHAGFAPRTRGVTFGSDGETIATQFAESDCIYVYNETKQAFAREPSGELIALHPSNISGASCDLSGDLSFFIWNTNAWTLVDVGDADSYSFFYQMNLPSAGENNFPSFDYAPQDGGADSVSSFDFAQASGLVMTKNPGSLTLPEGVLLANLQSMFRLRLSYTHGGVAVTPESIVSLSIDTENETLVGMYSPTDTENPYYYSSFALVPPVFSSDNDIFVALAFRYDLRPAEGDRLILTAKDAEGNVYQGVKSVPSDGFDNSRYYYGSVSLAWVAQYVKPTISHGSDNESYVLWSDGDYDYKGSANPDPTVVSILGNSIGYYFTFGNDAQITLGGDGTAVFSDTEPFVYGEFGLTIILSSNYTIDCRNNDSAIWADGGDLKLQTTGSVQTLTVIANDPDYRGLYGDFNYDGLSSSVSSLGSDGYTVELTSSTDGPDEDEDGDPDYYTWVYTVTPMP